MKIFIDIADGPVAQSLQQVFGLFNVEVGDAESSGTVVVDDPAKALTWLKEDKHVLGLVMPWKGSWGGLQDAPNFKDQLTLIPMAEIAVGILTVLTKGESSENPSN